MKSYTTFEFYLHARAALGHDANRHITLREEARFAICAPDRAKADELFARKYGPNIAPAGFSSVTTQPYSFSDQELNQNGVSLIPGVLATLQFLVGSIEIEGTLTLLSSQRKEAHVFTDEGGKKRVFVADFELVTDPQGEWRVRLEALADRIVAAY